MAIKNKLLKNTIYETWQKHEEDWMFIGWLPIDSSKLVVKSEDSIYIYATHTRIDGIIDEYRFRK